MIPAMEAVAVEPQNFQLVEKAGFLL